MPAMNPSPDISQPSQNIQTGTYRNYRKTLEELLTSSPPSLALHNLLEGTPAAVLRRLSLRAALRGCLKFGLPQKGTSKNGHPHLKHTNRI